MYGCLFASLCALLLEPFELCSQNLNGISQRFLFVSVMRGHFNRVCTCCQSPFNFSGYCIAVPLDDNEAFIASFEVRPEFRGKGVGTELLKMVIKSVGDRNISLYSVIPAESLYNRAGFTTGDKPSYLQQVNIIPKREGFAGK